LGDFDTFFWDEVPYVIFVFIMLANAFDMGQAANSGGGDDKVSRSILELG